jgi:hypothetical protein
MKTEEAKQRLVQQMARLDTLEGEIASSQQQNATDARARIGEIDARLAKLRPVVEKWIARKFLPDTPALRKVAEEYCDLTGERYDCILAEGLATAGDDGDAPDA